jgi:hypothetical protein
VRAAAERRHDAAERVDVGVAERSAQLGFHAVALGQRSGADGLAAVGQGELLGPPVGGVGALIVPAGVEFSVGADGGPAEAVCTLPVGGTALLAGDRIVPPWAV